jgi:Helix-turn-helix domain
MSSSTIVAQAAAINTGELELARLEALGEERAAALAEDLDCLRAIGLRPERPAGKDFFAEIERLWRTSSASSPAPPDGLRTVAEAAPKLPRQRKPRISTPDGLRTAAEAAARLGCSIKTLNGHVDAGDLHYVIIGQGKKRPRRMFTDSDLDAFIASRTRKDSPCPLPTSRARHTGTSISKCEVIDFAGPRKPPTGAKRKK